MTLPDRAPPAVPSARSSGTDRLGPSAAHSQQLLAVVHHLLLRSRHRCEQSRQLLADSRAASRSYTGRAGPG